MFWLSGGRRIDPSHFKPVTDPAIPKRVGDRAGAELVRPETNAEGMTDCPRELPDVFSYKTPSHGRKAAGSFRGDPLPVELFRNGRRMPVARWPNKGFARYDKPVAGVRDYTKPYRRPKVAGFLHADDRPARRNVDGASGCRDTGTERTIVPLT